MRPTISEQLDGARRLLSSLPEPTLSAHQRELCVLLDRAISAGDVDEARRLSEQVLADSTLDAHTSSTMRDVRKLLRRIVSHKVREEFLRWDNTAMRPILHAARPLLPSLFPSVPTTGDDLAAQNYELRDLLSLAIEQLADSADGHSVRREIAAHLRVRVDANPNLNKNPTPVESS